METCVSSLRVKHEGGRRWYRMRMGKEGIGAAQWCDELAVSLSCESSRECESRRRGQGTPYPKCPPALGTAAGDRRCRDVIGACVLKQLRCLHKVWRIMLRVAGCCGDSALFMNATLWQSRPRLLGRYDMSCTWQTAAVISVPPAVGCRPLSLSASFAQGFKSLSLRFTCLLHSHVTEKPAPNSYNYVSSLHFPAL